MQNILTGKVERRCDEGATRFRRIFVLLHQPSASEAKLHTCKSVDGVIDAAVAGNKTAQHLTVRCIDNGIALQGCDITLPKINILLDRLEIAQVDDLFST